MLLRHRSISSGCVLDCLTGTIDVPEGVVGSVGAPTRSSGVWYGHGLQLIGCGLCSEALTPDLVDVFEFMRRPGGVDMLPPASGVGLGFEVRIGVPRSVNRLLVSALMRHDAEYAGSIVDAHVEAVGNLLETMEGNDIYVIDGPEDSILLRGGMIAAAFLHQNRVRSGGVSSDPALHTHLLVSSVGMAPDGLAAPVSIKALECAWENLGEQYCNNLMDGITRRFGVGWVPWQVSGERYPVYEIKGMNPEAFSQMSE